MIQGRWGQAAGALLAVLGFAGVAQAAPNVQSVPGEYVVRLKETIATQNVTPLSQILGGEVGERFGLDKNLVVVKRSPLEREDYVVSTLKSNPMVANAEPNFIYTIDTDEQPTTVPNDPEFNALWGLHNTDSRPDGLNSAGIDVDALKAWEITTGSDEVVIAVIDTGVDYTIDDLVPNVWTNDAELNGEAGVDDDGNGFVDDIYGMDFANEDSDPMDDHGHGSHCAGTIGASGNNGIGIVGVAQNVKLMGIKFLTARGGGTLEGAIKSIDYATLMGVDVMSNSWGGGGFSEELKNSIIRAKEAGILFTAAAGNSRQNNDARPTYPATYDVDNIVSVAAIDSRGRLASFSSYGATTVDVAAPGVNVLSTTPDGLKSWSGTSMATPHVSGVAALVLANEPEITMTDLRDRLINTTKPVSAVRGKVASGGIVSAYYALINESAPVDPDDPWGWEKVAEQVSTDHPYANDASQEWTLSVPGASQIAVVFSRFETERSYDTVEFIDASGAVVGTMSGSHDGGFSPIITGDTVTLRLTTDGSVNRYGFDVEAIAYR
ncbi:MAG: S8 family serine peptidase [Bdellovibrionales bacterium]|nr:S8 family serine peptidase [Bdellovibrionales bacterium]